MSPEARAGFMDALSKLWAAKHSGKSKRRPINLPPIETEIDPDLLEPDSEKQPDDTQYDIEDPDNVLADMKSASDDDSDQYMNDNKNQGSNGESQDQQSDQDGESQDGESGGEDEVPEDGLADHENDHGFGETAAEKEARHLKDDLNRTKGIGREMAAQAQASDDPEKQKLGKELEDMIDDLEKIIDGLGSDPEDILNHKDEIVDKLNEIIAKMSEIDRQIYVQGGDQKVRKIQELENTLKDPATMRRLEQEDRTARIQQANKRTEIERRKAEINKIQNMNLPGTDALSDDLYDMIDSLVTDIETRQDTYSRINNKYDTEPTIMPGDIEDIKQDVKKPLIEVFIDRSGSWDDSTKTKALNMLSQVIDDFVSPGRCDLDIWYFNDYLSRTPQNGGGTGAWTKILEQIKKDEAENVIIVTDKDMAGQANNNPGYMVDGVVWWVWKTKDYRCPELVRKLRGTNGYKEYVLF